MSPTSSNPAVIISGCSTGIGLACALRLDAAGYRVFAGVRKDSDADALRSKASGHLSPIMLDVTSADSIAQAAAHVKEAVGVNGLAGLVNNAGIALNSPCEYLEADDLRRQFEVNLFGLAALTRACLPLLRPTQGRIINISSITGRSTLPFMGPYSASKHAVESYSDALRVELRPWNMRVVLIEPGATQSEMWDKGYEQGETFQANISDEGKALYGTRMAAAFAMGHAAGSRAVPADIVARRVEHALRARRPRARYLVGIDAKLQIWLERIPTRLRDYLLDWSMRRFM